MQYLKIIKIKLLSFFWLVFHNFPTSLKLFIGNLATFRISLKSISISLVIFFKNLFFFVLLFNSFISNFASKTFPLIIIFLISASILIFLISPIFSGEIQNTIRELIPNKILLEFSEEGYKNLDATRLEIYKNALDIISRSPLLGIGAASFTAIYEFKTNFYKGHSHNLLTELAISYGLPVTIIFALTIVSILAISYYAIFLRNLKSIDYFERACWASVFFFFLSQLVDIQYFDGKISIIAWILIASLKNIIDKDSGNLKNTN